MKKFMASVIILADYHKWKSQKINFMMPMGVKNLPALFPSYY
ncbi:MULTISPECIES: hypothetical protein [Flavobacterium]|nr:MULTISPECIES: hypothetical protein [Flavobacterium]